MAAGGNFRWDGAAPAPVRCYPPAEEMAAFDALPPAMKAALNFAKFPLSAVDVYAVWRQYGDAVALRSIAHTESILERAA